MATNTNYLKLIKPDYNDVIDVALLNKNSDTLDTEVNRVKNVNDTQNTKLTNHENRLTTLESKTYPYLPLTGGTITGDLTISNNLLVQGKLISKNREVQRLYTITDESIKDADLKNLASVWSTGVEATGAYYSWKLFQDPVTLWTELFIYVTNSYANIWYKIKTPVKWKSANSTFITTSLSRKSSPTDLGADDNVVTYISEDTFMTFSRSDVEQMYHFCGYAKEVYNPTNTTALCIYDDETAKATEVYNLRSELQQVNEQLKEFDVAVMCDNGDDTTDVVINGNVNTLTSDELDDLHTTVNNRRFEIIKRLKELK